MELLAEAAGLRTDERAQRMQEVLAEIERRGLHSVRVSFADLHGVLRGKTLRADLIADAFDNGVGITSALLLKDTGQRNVFPVWATGGGLEQPWLTGAGDVMMLPDPSTFRVLPWVDGTGWLLSDLVGPDGEAVDLSTRSICRSAEQALEDRGYALQAGLEVEFHLYRLASAEDRDAVMQPSATAPVPLALDVRHTHPGRVYLGETRFDLIEPFVGVLRDDLAALGMPPRSLEVELGPSQVELTFSPGRALEVADQAILLRSSVKQIARRNGWHATFMARPHVPESFSSGWHLHQSLVDRSGTNLFAAAESAGVLSTVGDHYLAGLLRHAVESCLLTTPTVTGYKRYRSESLAPLCATWARQHRGAMLRIIGGNGAASTRIENRVGDSAANPYLYVASQIHAGSAGIDQAVAAPPAATNPYDEAEGERLPRTLDDAITAFAQSEMYRAALGTEFVDYLTAIKSAEWDRFVSAVTDWEQAEYFEFF